MKKFSRIIFGLLASAMLVAGSVSFVSCSDDDDTNSSNSSSDANGSGSGSSSSGSSESGSGSSGSGSSGSTVSEATASVTELAYDSDTLNNKVFSYEDEDDGVRYITFTGGKCYESSSLDYIGRENDDLFISCNNKIYRSQKATRTSGSGLFATFDDGDEYKYTLNSDGTGSIDFYEDGYSFSCTFTNNAGLVTISFTYEGETFTGVMYYNGENLYDQKEELTFVKNYSAN